MPSPPPDLGRAASGRPSELRSISDALWRAVSSGAVVADARACPRVGFRAYSRAGSRTAHVAGRRPHRCTCSRVCCRTYPVASGHAARHATRHASTRSEALLQRRRADRRAGRQIADRERPVESFLRPGEHGRRRLVPHRRYRAFDELPLPAVPMGREHQPSAPSRTATRLLRPRRRERGVADRGPHGKPVNRRTSEPSRRCVAEPVGSRATWSSGRSDAVACGRSTTSSRTRRPTRRPCRCRSRSRPW